MLQGDVLHGQRAHFTLVIAEGSPSGAGHQTAAAMLGAGVPVRVIEPRAVARSMAQVALVLCGADAVLGDGGVLGVSYRGILVRQAHSITNLGGILREVPL